MDEGYIKLSRNTLHNDFLMGDEKAFCLFVKLILKADWKTGTLVTGRVKLSKLTGYNGNPAYKALKRLEREGMVVLETDRSKTKVIICNYDKWQGKGGFSVTTREQLGNNPGNNPNNNVSINKNDYVNNLGNKLEIGESAGGNTIQKEEEEELNKYNPSNKSSGSIKTSKDEKLKIELEAVMKIVNPNEKFTSSRLSLMRARRKEYSFDEIKSAASELSKSRWHKENKQMSIDNLLRPSKFGTWYQKAQHTRSYTIPGSIPTSKSSVYTQEKEMTAEQKERGKLVKQLITEGYSFSEIGPKSVQELRKLLSVE